ncbi:MAG: SUMF1/EgtB/PvdO family nonheme iron enzyme [Myxococcota bacterium]
MATEVGARTMGWLLVGWFGAACAASCTTPEPIEEPPQQGEHASESSAPSSSSIRSSGPDSVAADGAPAPTPPAPEDGATEGNQHGATDKGSITTVEATNASEACPEGMVFVETRYCDTVEDTCIAPGKYNGREDFFSICGAYSSERPCVGQWWTMRFCIDRYEYPNRKGAHPPTLVDAWDAAAMCRAKGKRLCWEDEWTAACEGSGRTPYPYGYRRAPDSTVCRNDVPEVPTTRKMWSSNPKLQDAEARKHDASVPSGSMPQCKSDFGVYDLTANVDEWTFQRAQRPSEVATWAVLKGGWWGRIRNACRPTLTGHREDFRYYPVSFRCCADPSSEAMATALPEEAPEVWIHPPEPEVSFHPKRPLSRGWTPDDPKFAVFNKAHAQIRERVLKRVHPKFVDPLTKGIDALDAPKNERSVGHQPPMPAKP